MTLDSESERYLNELADPTGLVQGIGPDDVAAIRDMGANAMRELEHRVALGDVEAIRAFRALDEAAAIAEPALLREIAAELWPGEDASALTDPARVEALREEWRRRYPRGLKQPEVGN